MRAIDLACPQELSESPELALLAVLDATLQQATYALFAAHPELVGTRTLEDYGANGPQLWAADALYDNITTLQHAIQRYHQAIAVARAHNHQHDEPF